MNKIQYHKDLFELIKSSPNSLVDVSFIEIDNTQSVVLKAKEMSINYEIIQNKIRLMTNSIGTKVYNSIDSFLTVRSMEENSNILIINDEDGISFFENTTYINFEQKPNYLVTNHFVFIEFLSILKLHERESDDAFHFVDSFNKDLRKISLVSLSDKGRLNITYDLIAPLFDTSRNLKISLERFKACFDNENKSLMKFLKTSIIASATNYPADRRLKMLIESLDEIIEKARMNFEVYLNNLSIDKIKKDYDDVKAKYFDSLSDILSKLSTKIIALPIGISATLFAVNNVNNSNFFLIFILAIIIITSMYISLLLRIHFKDLIYISRIFHYDYDTLLSNKFFTKYPDEVDLFEEIKRRITDRISFLKIIIQSYYWIMSISNIIICLFIISIMINKINALIFIAMVLMLITIQFRNYVLDEYETNESQFK